MFIGCLPCTIRNTVLTSLPCSMEDPPSTVPCDGSVAGDKVSTNTPTGGIDFGRCEKVRKGFAEEVILKVRDE